MKYLGVGLLALSLALSSCNQAVEEKKENNSTETKTTMPLTTVQFEHTHHDFGTVKEDGGKISHIYKFKNTGTNPFKIESVTASCGCTTPDYSKDPVAPGGEGYVKAEFDPKGRKGANSKSLKVKANIQAPDQLLELTFKCEVE